MIFKLFLSALSLACLPKVTRTMVKPLSRVMITKKGTRKHELWGLLSLKGLGSFIRAFCVNNDRTVDPSRIPSNIQEASKKAIGIRIWNSVLFR